MSDNRPYVLLEHIDKLDCRFVATWLTKAAEVQELWLETEKDRDFWQEIGLIHNCIIPDLGAFALELVGKLEHSDYIAAIGLYSHDNFGLFCSEFSLLARLGFFVTSGAGYMMALPNLIDLAKVKRAAWDLISTTTDEDGYGFSIMKPERLLETMPQSEAEARRLRLVAMQKVSTLGSRN
jgi:hypothetical protein